MLATSRNAGVREFAMAHGEMSGQEFRDEFLAVWIRHVKQYSAEDAHFYLCMDWRHSADLEHAASPHLGRLKNLIVWKKTNAGLGSGYRSQHELIHYYGGPGGLKLGSRGRSRSNVWTYAGCSSFGRDRDSSLAMHPTVKPVAMIADALMDCSKRNAIVLDPFGTQLSSAGRPRPGRSHVMPKPVKRTPR